MQTFNDERFNSNRELLLNHFLQCQADDPNQLPTYHWDMMFIHFYLGMESIFAHTINLQRQKRDYSLSIIDICVLVLTTPLCTYTQVPLTIENISFDRIDNRLGYHFSNVVLCTSVANGAKSALYESDGVHVDNTWDIPTLAVEIQKYIEERDYKLAKKAAERELASYCRNTGTS